MMAHYSSPGRPRPADGTHVTFSETVPWSPVASVLGAADATRASLRGPRLSLGFARPESAPFFTAAAWPHVPCLRSRVDILSEPCQLHDHESYPRSPQRRRREDGKRRENSIGIEYIKKTCKTLICPACPVH
eukprot:scaffold1940_cov112-Isochrysis_galbana.AAC.1